jgi:TonB-dependent SusC/RagA subfamily outer membrane receptor
LFAVALVSTVARPSAGQQQATLITGRITAEQGGTLELANVFIQEMSLSAIADEQGRYTMTIPPARASGQTVVLRVRRIGYVAAQRQITLTPGTQTQDFALKQDLNRLDEVVVTGVVGEGIERSKVPFAVGRVTAEDIPVPSFDPLRALAGKVAGLRVAQTSGVPGSGAEIMLRGPNSINASGRSHAPLIIVDGAIMNVGSLEEIGALDIESVEVVKGAAGASLYGTRAANGVITIRTKRGAASEGVAFNVRTEYGFNDLSSIDYGLPINHHLQLDETGTRICVAGGGAISGCTRTVKFMDEIMRINSVNADTNRTGQPLQWNVPSGAELLNVYQANIWPDRYYSAVAQMIKRQPIVLNAIDARGTLGNVRFYVSGSYTNEAGAVLNLDGQQHRRARVNLDYDLRSNITVALSTMYDKANTDLQDINLFGAALRGAPAGTDYLARDTLGRPIIRGGGTPFRGTGNGGGAFLYETENSSDRREAVRFLGNMTLTWIPLEWATFEGVVGYDNRQRNDRQWFVKGYRTQTISTGTNNGNMDVGNATNEAYNASLTATFQRQLTPDLHGRLSLRGLMDEEKNYSNSAEGEYFIVNDIFSLDNIRDNKDVGSSSSLIRNMGLFAGAMADYKDRYILDATFRYDGSSLFGSGNRWAPFGRLSAVWRASEEPFWAVPYVTDFRLRASRGTAGSTPNFSAQYETYNVSASAISLGQAGNSQLKPQTTTETELGTELTLFDRLGLEVTHAFSNTKDQILLVNTPASFGFTQQWRNAGAIENKSWEVAFNLPVVTRSDLQWSMRGTWDRVRTHITDLNMPDYFTGNTFMSDNPEMNNGFEMNRFGNLWGRRFYRSCAELPNRNGVNVQAMCGDGRAFQVNDAGWVVWVGEGNTWGDGITKNLWGTKLPAAQSPWNFPLYFGHPILDRPLAGEAGEGSGVEQILGNMMPDFRMSLSNTFQYKRLNLYALLDGTFGHEIYNQGEAWGLLDYNSASFDHTNRTVETAKPVGYTWRIYPSGSGGFYDQLAPNNYNVETGSFIKLREVSATYRIGAIAGVGEWTVGVVGRNIATITDYSGYDPETGGGGGQLNSGLLNQIDDFDFPTLRTFTLSLSTRF